MFCRDDPDEPDFKIGKVWREKISEKHPGLVTWTREPRVEKVRKRGLFGQFIYKKLDDSDDEDCSLSNAAQDIAIDEKGVPVRSCRFSTPPPSPLVPRSLSVELTLKHYSRHQRKPKAMFTFQCMQEMKRCEYSSHYQNYHAEIQEGLDGWLVSRCPLNIYGCPYAVNRVCAGVEKGEIGYSSTFSTFCIRPSSPVPAGVKKKKTAFSLTSLPFEILHHIAGFLDSLSLNNLSLTCHLLRKVCFALFDEKGIVIQEWKHQIRGGKVSWKLGQERWFFSRCFHFVRRWDLKDVEHMGSHLLNCPFNKSPQHEVHSAWKQFLGQQKLLPTVRLGNSLIALALLVIFCQSLWNFQCT